MRGRMVSTWYMSYEGVKNAMAGLIAGNPVDQAIIQAIKTVEDNKKFKSVGYGGLPNLDGVVELDAAFMNGDTLSVGAVMSVQNVKNPILVAHDLSKYNRNCILAGSGAERYAQKNGFEFCNMLTEESRQRYLNEKKTESELEEMGAYKGHDTVCIIGMKETTISCGVSTSGLFLKRPGRVGDTPLVGSGFYADSEVGAAAATGVGEDILKGCLSYSIVERMRNGMDVQTACETALADHKARMKKGGTDVGDFSVIAMDKNHGIGAATILPRFPFVVGGMDGKCEVYAAEYDDGRMTVHKVGEEWLQQYNGD